jgi:hypothetical protein
MKITRHMRILSLFVIAFVAMIGATASASADSTDYTVDWIKVNGLTLTGSGSTTTLDVERGDRLDIEVYLTGNVSNNGTVDDVYVTARIMGYEFGSITDSVGPFSIDDENTYKKVLTLYVPEDIDSSEDYTLRVEVSDKTSELTEELNLHVDEQRHNLRIYDTLLNPSNTIAAGNPLFVTVRLENLGEMEENDIKITASIPDLGVSTVNYMDELNTESQESGESNYEEDSSEQLDLLLRIPSDAATGTYEVRIDVEYNRGYNFISDSLEINIEGAEAEEEIQTVVNSDSNTKTTNVGSTIDYKVMIANLGSESGVYSVQVDGISAWGEAIVQPGFLTVMPDSTGEIIVSVTPTNEEAATYTWVAKIMHGNELLNEMVFTTTVESSEVVEESKDSLKAVLAVIFGLLVVVLIVLALVIAFRKVKGDEEDEDATLEGQAYYQYYPKQ